MAAESLEEALQKYRTADEHLLAAMKAFRDAPWTNQSLRTETWDRLKEARDAYNEAIKDLSDFVTGQRK